jgi:hypothetical protein
LNVAIPSSQAAWLIPFFHPPGKQAHDGRPVPATPHLSARDQGGPDESGHRLKKVLLPGRRVVAEVAALADHPDEGADLLNPQPGGL